MADFYTDEDCSFCSQYVLRTTPNAWAANWGDVYTQISDLVYETPELLLVAGLGALSEGYVLLLPKPHYPSIAQLPAPIRNRISELKAGVRTFLEQHYHSAVFFEHGAVTERKKGACCIEHAHIHAFPCDVDLRPALERNFAEVRIHSLDDLAGTVDADSPYIFYENQSGEMFVYKTPIYTPSQFVRKVWAQALRREKEWDWAVSANEANVARTIETFSAFSLACSERAPATKEVETNARYG